MNAHVYYFMLLFIGAYLLAAIPSGLLISRKVEKLDITKAGSGNIGAANVAREVGLKWGLITLLIDILKGFVPVVAAHYLIGSSAGISEALKGIIGISALLGHQFPVYHYFKGGKGVATCLGVFLAISPISCLFSVIIFIILVYLWRYISLGSISAAVTMPLWLYIMGHSTTIIFLSMIMSFLIIFQHRANIQRLIQGTERMWQKGTYRSRSIKRPRSSSE
ncbi:MAG TPA: glycerol-3-phosphate 1-O-acyltransferase PlsY [Desulfatiglandales bacterium]|nr:glycerol-3-phosphate 1-O-acyltransferase PlsY [Desulfatiglandales bacterium]